jgi:peptidoglycan-associated lipoprotein
MLVPVILSCFPSEVYPMKSLNTLTAIAIAASLVVGVTGCRKTPKNVTSIPRTNLQPIQDERGNVTLPGGQQGIGSGKTLPNDGSTSGNLNGGSTSLPPFDPTTAGIQNTRPDPGQYNEDKTTLAAESVHFEFDRANVKSSEVPKVQRVATYLKNQANAMIRVEGNCDERGTEEYNRSLGERRALAVRELLIASGVAADRVTTVTYGEDQPADPGHDQAAWDKNRRADFVVLTPKGTQ